MDLVTLTTDFRAGEYVAAMKGVILGIHPSAHIVDLTHDVPPQDVRAGAFLLMVTTRHYPPAVHVAVVDPGVGTSRRPLAVECERGLFVGPDNGLLVPAAEVMGVQRVYEITNRRFLLSKVSRTFHGRDVFAPAAAHLAKGVEPRKLGPAVEDWITLDFGHPKVVPGEVRGTILWVDRFGNVVTNVTAAEARRAFRLGDDLAGNVGGHRVRATFEQTFAEVDPGEYVAFIDAWDYLEVSRREGNAAASLGCVSGQGILLRRAT